jgi:hypothetical protein
VFEDSTLHEDPLEAKDVASCGGALYALARSYLLKRRTTRIPTTISRGFGEGLEEPREEPRRLASSLLLGHSPCASGAHGFEGFVMGLVMGREPHLALAWVDVEQFKTPRTFDEVEGVP